MKNKVARFYGSRCSFHSVYCSWEFVFDLFRESVVAMMTLLSLSL